MRNPIQQLLVALFALALSLSLSTGCGPGTVPDAPAALDSAATPQPVTDLRQTMEWILDPSADVIWESAGTIITAEGETELAPTTDEGWDNVRNHAAIVAETGNLLMMSGRSAGIDWDEYAQGLRAAGQRAIEAAEVHDSEALFDAGGQLYRVCLGCHQQYAIPAEEVAGSQ